MTELLYFANPMCSWCRGFAPSLRAAQERWPDLRITLALGAFDPERARRPMADRDRAYVRHHWERVREASGQPFDFSFFERAGFIYDTEPASRALLLIRHRFPALALPALHRLQGLFYAHNVDVTDRDRLCAFAGEFGIGAEEFGRDFDDPALAAALLREWQETARLGVTGYPTLLALADGRAQVVTIGWRPPAELLAALERLGVGA